jgi:hypothetical protein
MLNNTQKEQLKMARRANERINETWNLFTMYLAQDKRPAEALELAQEAVSVWAEFQDHNEVDPPEIERPDIGGQLRNAMQKAVEDMEARRAGSGMIVVDPEEGIAQFSALPRLQPEPAAPANPPTDPVQE